MLRPEAIAELTNTVFFANANRAASALVDPAISGDTDIYPDETVRAAVCPAAAAAAANSVSAGAPGAPFAVWSKA
ncbi:hypothetical protein [Pseudomonas sp.]|uniref:hypothetical protein n=1 Tax=Pseudomonas sp. TaxID=306 RepID=UPI003BB59CCF